MENTDVKVSVIVLTYNHEKYIGQALDSILMQKVDFQYEILVSDDASTDGTSKIVEKYKERYPGIIRYLRQNHNVGASRNAYEAMQSAHGRYLATCEGDDYWTDAVKLQIQVDYLEKNPGLSGCVHPIQIVDEYGIPTAKQRLAWVSDKQLFTINDFRGIFLPGHGVSMVRRNYFLDTNFEASIIYDADPDIADRTNALIWLSKGDFAQINRVMACYRKRSDGTNLTSRLYKNNVDHIEKDFAYTKKLEKYAFDILHVDADFEYHKQELFVSSLIKTVCHPCSKNIGLMKEILSDANSKLRYLGLIIPILLKKAINKYLKCCC